MFKPLLATPLDSVAEPAHRRRFDLPIWRRSQVCGTELLIAAASLFFSLCSNGSFWSAILGDRNWSSPSTWLFGAVMFLIITAVHGLILGLVVTRRTAKPVLLVLFVLTAMVSYFMQRYGILFDAGMLRNILHTDFNEARELLSFGLLSHVAIFGIFPGMLVARLDLAERSWRRAIISRTGFLFVCIAVAVGGTILVFQDLSAVMRNQKAARYLITPGNYLVSTVRVLAAERRQPGSARLPVGVDARLATTWTDRRKPALLVIVVGETVRAANWGLNGYARQTTPKLAARDVLNYPNVDSCGTNTEASLPCMFSPFGRKNYDEDKIHRHESLLHVLEHSSFHTIWRDNQSGCKGVCDGLDQKRMDSSQNASLCDGGRCLDEILVEGLAADIGNAKGNTVIVLHQLGNHGPAYSSRYPSAFRRFTPTCDTADLGQCTREQIINSYDNAVLYTDHVLDRVIQKIKTQNSHDAAMIYISDHGESLGEKGFYLHGLPYAIAPKEQTQVPMVMWLSNGFASSFGIDANCMRKQSDRQVSHDYLFHSVLGMLQVATNVYERPYDLTASCRS